MIVNCRLKPCVCPTKNDHRSMVIRISPLQLNSSLIKDSKELKKSPRSQRVQSVAQNQLQSDEPTHFFNQIQQKKILNLCRSEPIRIKYICVQNYPGLLPIQNF